jgi:hypothetical protein
MELLPQGTVAVVDRFFSSVVLALQLRSRGQHLIATIMTNRKGFPKTLRLDKKAPRGASMVAFCATTGVRLVTWRDNKDVSVISTVGLLRETVPVKRKGRHMRVRAAIQVNMPTMIARYVQQMGGVDSGDCLRSTYCIEKVVKVNFWYKRLFLGLVGFMIMNAYVLYRCCANKPSRGLHRAFTLECVYELLGCQGGNPFGQKEGEQHFLEPNPKNKKGKIRNLTCILCSAENRMHRGTCSCSVCKVPLCCPSTGRDCFKRYHKEDYDEASCRKRRPKPRAVSSPNVLPTTRKRKRGRPKSSPTLPTPPTPVAIILDDSMTDTDSDDLFK